MATKKPTRVIFGGQTISVPATPKTPVKKTPAQKAQRALDAGTKAAESARATIEEQALNTQLKLKQAQTLIENPDLANTTVSAGTFGTRPMMPPMPADFLNEFQKQYQNEYGLDFGGTTYVAPPESTGRELYKQLLLSKGYPKDIIDSSLDFIEDVMRDMGVSFTDKEKMKDVKEVYENLYSYTTKDNRTIYSPFMSKYGDYIKASQQTGISTELKGTDVISYVNAVESAVKQYGLNPLYASKPEILNYIKNNIDAKTFSQRLNEGRAATLTASEDYVQALKDQGYISGRNDLINFYVNPTKGEEIFNQNKISGVIGAAAIRAKRETPGMVNYDIATVQEAAKGYIAKGFNQQEATTEAEKAYEKVQADLAPTLTASGIYETRGPNIGKTASGQSLADLGRVGEIQSTLEKEQLLGNMASKRRKNKLAEMYAAGLMGSSGTAGSTSLGKNIQL